MTDAVARFSGFAELYDRVRPAPPAELAELLRRWTGIPDPEVVDLGAGTGLSTALWPRATGVEPNADMRTVALARGLHVVDGTAERTGLPDACADIVTAGQALHWFDPERTFPEVARLLRPGGVFAAFDCDWPPAVDWAVDQAYREFEVRHRALDSARGLRPAYADKPDHLARLRDSGLFRHVTEICLHRTDSGDAARLVDVARSQGGAVALLANGASEEEIGLSQLRKVAEHRMGTTPRPWWWTYRIRLATP